ncbi:MAG: peptidylprolyl isomerase [Rhodoglobus sp.]|nr:peptidylprolyl isomerase [Rhodoglobus sp.]
MRKLPALVVAAGLMVSLTSCAGGPTLFAGCESTGNAALVTAAGAFGADPEADFPTPLVAKRAELSVTQEGDGADVAPNGAVDATLSIYDAKTGEALQSQSGPLTAVSIRSFVDGRFPFTAALACATVGSRVVTTGTQTQLFGPAGLGLSGDPTIVIVTDVDKTYPAKANGIDQLAQPGFPDIVLAPNGQPGFTFPGNPPVDLRFAALKQGNGAKVKEGDTIIANLSGIVWGGTETFTSSWDNQSPAALLVSELDSSGSGLPKGLVKALVGQKVGSQVIAVVPSADAYPTGQAPGGVAEGDTLVFVVDILGIG